MYSPEKLKHPFSITLFEDWMYWTDWDRNAIFKANKFDGSKSDAVTSEDLVSFILMEKILIREENHASKIRNSFYSVSFDF